MSKRGRPRKERYALLMGGLWRNAKMRRLSNEALGVLVRAWSYAADEMTDGVVPLEMLEMWAKPKNWPRIRAELIKGDDVDGSRPLIAISGIDARMHDWTSVNISAAEWEAKLERDRTRKSAHFPDGNPPDIPPGIPSGIPPNFQGSALDEDEDERSDRSRESDQGASVARSLGAFGEDIRAGMQRIFEANRWPLPMRVVDLTWDGWPKIARWARAEAARCGRPEDAVAAEIVNGFVDSRKAEGAGYPCEFLLKNPLEYYGRAA